MSSFNQTERSESSFRRIFPMHVDVMLVIKLFGHMQSYCLWNEWVDKNNSKDHKLQFVSCAL